MPVRLYEEGFFPSGWEWGRGEMAFLAMWSGHGWAVGVQCPHVLMDPDAYHGLWRSVTEGQAWSLSHWCSRPVELGQWSCLVHTSQLLVWGINGYTELIPNPQVSQISLWFAEGSWSPSARAGERFSTKTDKGQTDCLVFTSFFPKKLCWGFSEKHLQHFAIGNKVTLLIEFIHWKKKCSPFPINVRRGGTSSLV